LTGLAKETADPAMDAMGTDERGGGEHELKRGQLDKAVSLYAGIGRIDGVIGPLGRVDLLSVRQFL
jgi:hypothetical protein